MVVVKRVAILALLGYGLLLGMEILGLTGYDGPGSGLYQQVWAGGVVMAVRLGCLCVALLASFKLAGLAFCRSKDSEQFCRTVQGLFDTVSVPLLAVREDASVTLINKAARDLIRGDSQLDFPIVFSHLFEGECPEMNADYADGHVWTMLRKDGSTFPAALKISPVRLSSKGVACHGSAQQGSLYMIALRDMTPILRLQEQVEQSTRLQTAVEVASELGHWVRNPLTAIRVAGDFAASVLTDSLSHGPKVSRHDVSHLVSMCQIISEETDRLERKLEQFLNCADKDHDTLLGLMADAEAWAKRLKPASGEKINA